MEIKFLNTISIIDDFISDKELNIVSQNENVVVKMILN